MCLRTFYFCPKAPRSYLEIDITFSWGLKSDNAQYFANRLITCLIFQAQQPIVSISSATAYREYFKRDSLS